MDKKLLVSFFICLSVKGSTLGVPDGDSAILWEMLLTDIEATAGILEMLKVSKDTLDTVQEAQFAVESAYTKTVQTSHYVNRVSNFKQELEAVKTISSVRNNMRSGVSLYEDTDEVVLSKVKRKTKEVEMEDKVNDSLQLRNKVNRDNLRNNKMLNDTLSRDAKNLKTTAQGATTGAKATTLTNSYLEGVNAAINLQNDILLHEKEKKDLEEKERILTNFNRMKQLGVIPKDATLKDFQESMKRGSL